MRTRDPFGEVLETLRHRIRQGDIAPGAPLIVMDLAAELRVSATPVREALAHLAGEGVVEGRQGQLRGYWVGRPGPADLADLLRLHQALVITALGAAPQRPGTGLDRRPMAAGASEVDWVARTEALFAGLVALGGGGPLRRAHRQIADRLHLVRLREGAVLSGLEAEIEGLEGAGPSMAVAIRAYHRRRLSAVVRLAGLLREDVARG